MIDQKFEFKTVLPKKRSAAEVGGKPAFRMTSKKLKENTSPSRLPAVRFADLF